MKQLDEYFFLFFNPQDQEQREIFDFKLELMENYEETIQKGEYNEPVFPSYEEFIKYSEKQGIKD